MYTMYELLTCATFSIGYPPIVLNGKLIQPIVSLSMALNDRYVYQYQIPDARYIYPNMLTSVVNYYI